MASVNSPVIAEPEPEPEPEPELENENDNDSTSDGKNTNDNDKIKSSSANSDNNNETDTSNNHFQKVEEDEFDIVIVGTGMVESIIAAYELSLLYCYCCVNNNLLFIMRSEYEKNDSQEYTNANYKNENYN